MCFICIRPCIQIAVMCIHEFKAAMLWVKLSYRCRRVYYYTDGHVDSIADHIFDNRFRCCFVIRGPPLNLAHFGISWDHFWRKGTNRINPIVGNVKF